MNFLKKKIKTVKTVVHGKRNKDDDDDDFDNYVPEVPPHPSTLAENGAPSTAASNLFPVNFPAHFQSTLDSLGSVADSTVKSLVGLGLSDAQKPEEPKEDLSLDQLKEREQENKKAEKDKIKQQEESKKDNEEWKYFLSLTAKVEAVTSKTQSALTKLKDESAVDEISALEDPCFLDRYDQSAPKGAGGWIAFEEQERVNPADPILKQPTGKSPRPTSYEPILQGCILLVRRSSPTGAAPGRVDEKVGARADRRFWLHQSGSRYSGPSLGKSQPCRSRRRSFRHFLY